MKRPSRVKPSFVCIKTATALAHIYFQKNNFVDTYISQLIKIAIFTNLKSEMKPTVVKQKFVLCMVQYAYINH